MFFKVSPQGTGCGPCSLNVSRPEDYKVVAGLQFTVNVCDCIRDNLLLRHDAVLPGKQLQAGGQAGGGTLGTSGAVASGG